MIMWYWHKSLHMWSFLTAHEGTNYWFKPAVSGLSLLSVAMEIFHGPPISPYGELGDMEQYRCMHGTCLEQMQIKRRWKTDCISGHIYSRKDQRGEGLSLCGLLLPLK